jgi:hypothetical protein
VQAVMPRYLVEELRHDPRAEAMNSASQMLTAHAPLGLLYEGFADIYVLSL